MSENTFVGDLVNLDPLASVRRQKKKAEDVQNQMLNEQKKVRDDLKKQQEQEQQAEADAALRARRKAIRSAGRTDFNRGTILTSPIGVPGQPTASGKTLLGM